MNTTYKFLLCASIGTIIVTSASPAFAQGSRYNAITHAVMTKTTEGQLFTLGEIALPHHMDAEDTKFSGKPVYRDFFSLDSY